jgi:FixJ family two-component response regulator
MTPAPAPTVFVVDDDDFVRASIQGMLKSVGLRSESFGTAQDFLRSKRPDAPSCLVLDVRLPGVSGLDFQRELAEHPDSHHLYHRSWRYSNECGR